MVQNKTYYTILSLTFLLIIIIFGVLNLGNSEHILANEKRLATPFPSLRVNSIDSFPKNFENYYSDNLLFRNELIQSYRDFKFYYLNINPSPDLIVIGKNDWLYQKDYVAAEAIDFNALNKELVARSEWCKQHKIELVIVVVPSKAKVYSEYLPDQFKPLVQQEINKINQFIESISDEDIRIIYLLSNLKKNKAIGKMYYQGDVHWTSKGAYVGYLELVKRLSLKGSRPQSDLVIYPDIKKDVNLIKLLGVSNYGNETEDLIMYMPFNKDVVDYSENTKGIESRRNNVTSIDSDSLSFPKAMIIRDSFMTALQPFLINNFSSTIFVWDDWKYSFNKKLILEHQPDLLFYIMQDSGFNAMIENGVIKCN
jgi:hypothetical protein